MRVHLKPGGQDQIGKEVRGSASPCRDGLCGKGSKDWLEGTVEQETQASRPGIGRRRLLEKVPRFLLAPAGVTSWVCSHWLLHLSIRAGQWAADWGGTCTKLSTQIPVPLPHQLIGF